MLSLGALTACAGSGGGGATAAAGPPEPLSPDAEAFAAYGIVVPRPNGWHWVSPDETVTPDTLAILQGPVQESDTSAPAVEISRRKLDAQSQRRHPTHVLTQLTTEMVQLFDAFEMIGSPEEIALAGRTAAQLKIKFTEALPDGGTVNREARFYGIIEKDSIWIIRCLGAPDGANDPEFDAVMQTVRFDT